VWGFFDILIGCRENLFWSWQIEYLGIFVNWERVKGKIFEISKKHLGQISQESIKSTYAINSLEEGKSTQRQSPRFRLLKFWKLILPHQSGCHLGHAADQWNTRFGPPEWVATKIVHWIRGNFSSHNRTPSNSACGDILDFVQGVVCLSMNFTDSTLKESRIPMAQTTQNSATCNVNKICKCF